MLQLKRIFARAHYIIIALFLLLSMNVIAADLKWDFSFSPSDITLSPSGEFTAISLTDGTNPRDNIGVPSIPAKYVNILLPDGATDVTVSATGDMVLLASDITPWPIQRAAPKSKPKPPFTQPDPVAYASADPWPSATATFQGLHEMQGYTFVSIRINPMVYIPNQKALYYRPNITVNVSYNISSPRGSSNTKTHSSLANEMVNSLVINPAQSSTAPRGSSSHPDTDYLIITSSSLAGTFQNLADYRATTAGGSFSTRVITIEEISSNYDGDDIQMKIRNCIKDLYYNHGLTYVVLGGDDTVVPDRDVYAIIPYDEEVLDYHMPSDLYYSDLTGTWRANINDSLYYGVVQANIDMSPEVIVGRIPIRTTEQLNGYINKLVAFEASITSHTRNSIIMGGPAAWSTYSGNDRPTDDVTGDGHPGFRDEKHITVCDSEMWLRRLYRDCIAPNWNNVESASDRIIKYACDYLTSWDTDICGDTPLSGSNLQNWLNNGYTHLMFSGHGDPQLWGLEEYGEHGEYYYFHSNRALQLTNLIPVVYTDACLTAAFDEDEHTPGKITIDVNTDYPYTVTSEPCLGEAFIRNPNGGALAYMGCSRYGWGNPDEPPATNYSDGGPSTVYAYKFYKRLYESAAVSTNRTIGQAFAMSKADMISQCANLDYERWIQFGLNYLGDPAIALYPRTGDPVTPPTVPYNISLADNDDNDDIISAATTEGGKHDITLTGRTLYKNGSWNTMCLPFDVSISSGPLSGDGVQVQVLNSSSSSLSGNTLTLYFEQLSGTTIPAGTPFIIKWNNGTNLFSPVFENVTISSTDPVSVKFDNNGTTDENRKCQFVGNYSPFEINDGNKEEIIYLGTNNTIGYATLTAQNPTRTLRCFRVHFVIPSLEGSGSKAVNRGIVNYADGTTSVISIHSTDSGSGMEQNNGWFSIYGIQLNSEPTDKGVYINNGKKVVIF